MAIILDGWMEGCLVERIRRLESFGSCHEASCNSQPGRLICPFRMNWRPPSWISIEKALAGSRAERSKPACILVSDSVNVVPILIIPSAI